LGTVDLLPHEVFLLSRIFTYDLNAAVDAHMAAVLVAYVRTGRVPDSRDEASARAAQYIALLADHPRPDAAAALTAYVVERSNGLADYVYARVLERHWLSTKRGMVREFVTEHGGELMGGPLPYVETGRETVADVVAIVAQALSGRFDDLKRYLSQHDMAIPWSARDAAQAIQWVQLHNAVANHRIARMVWRNEANAPAKARAILEAAKATAHPRVFLIGAVRTQQAAATWDRIAAGLFAVRFGL
jgi:short subunit dehydrogenase-like uncharacterized protein